MKVIVNIFFITLIPVYCFPQGEFNNWYFGHQCGITFASGTPAFLPGNPINTGGSIAEVSVSDSAGNLLFFSNGRKIYNRNKSVMPNGSGLLGGEINCQFMAVHDVVDNNLYYLFTIDHKPNEIDPSNGLHYSVIDMQLDGGLGDIVAGMKNIPLPFGDSAYIELTAIRHQNNKYAWVVSLRQGNGQNDKYLVYLIDSTGLNTTPVVSQSTLKNNLSGGGIISSIRVSSNGKYLFCTDSLTEMCLFNNSTGVVTPQFRF